MGFLDSQDKDELLQIIKESKNFAEVLIKIGRSANSGSNRMVLSQYVKDNGIDISHFDGAPRERSPEDIFVEHSTAPQKTLRHHYIKGNYSKYICAICGQLPIWNGQPLILTLDHINGKSDDHRLENLRWICPNCDRQLPTYGSKRLKKTRTCAKCGKLIAAEGKSGYCQKCFWEEKKETKQQRQKDNTKQHKKLYICPLCGNEKSKHSQYCAVCERNQRRLAWMQQRENGGITREYLKNAIRTKTFVEVGQMFDVSDNSVRKWCKKYNLPYKRSDINKYTDEEWKLI